MQKSSTLDQIDQTSSTQNSIPLHRLSGIPPRSSKEAFWIAFALCLATCLFILFVLSPLTGVSQTFGTETHDGYIEIARNLVSGNGYVLEEGGTPVFHRPPLYPFLLVPIALFPEFLQRPILVVVQSLMVGGIAFLVFEVSSKLFNHTTAKFSVVVFLLNPWLYWNAKNPMTPIVQALLYVSFIFLIFREIYPLLFGRPMTDQKSRVPPWLSIGLSGALLSLTHGTMIAVFLIWLLAVFLVGVFRRNWQTVRTSLYAGLIGVLVISPWTYRNWVVFNRFIPVVGGGGLMYFHGNNHWSPTRVPSSEKLEISKKDTRRDVIKDINEDQKNWHGLKDTKLDKNLTQKMIEDILAHPGIFAQKITLNALEYYFPAITHPFLAYGSNLKKEKLALTIYHFLLWTLAVWGFLGVRKKKNYQNSAILLFVAIVLYAVWYFPFLAFIGHSLYTFGTMSILSILTAIGIVHLFNAIFGISESTA